MVHLANDVIPHAKLRDNSLSRLLRQINVHKTRSLLSIGRLLGIATNFLCFLVFVVAGRHLTLCILDTPCEVAGTDRHIF